MAVIPFHCTRILPRSNGGTGNLSTGVKVGLVVSAALLLFCTVVIIWRILFRKGRNRGASEDAQSTASRVEKSFFDHFAEATTMNSSSFVKNPTRKLPKVPSAKHSPPASSSGISVADISAPVSKPKLSLSIDSSVRAKNILPSPNRSVSIHPPPLVKASMQSKYSLLAKPLPRLMNVTTTYVPLMSDELVIKPGEIVRMIEEYEDQWCLIQRVGRSEAEKGVCPRFCLSERQEIIPRKKARPSKLSFPAPASAFPVYIYHK